MLIAYLYPSADSGPQNGGSKLVVFPPAQKDRELPPVLLWHRRGERVQPLKRPCKRSSSGGVFSLTDPLPEYVVPVGSGLEQRVNEALRPYKRQRSVSPGPAAAVADGDGASPCGLADHIFKSAEPATEREAGPVAEAAGDADDGWQPIPVPSAASGLARPALQPLQRNAAVPQQFAERSQLGLPPSPKQSAASDSGNISSMQTGTNTTVPVPSATPLQPHHSPRSTPPLSNMMAVDSGPEPPASDHMSVEMQDADGAHTSPMRLIVNSAAAGAADTDMHASGNGVDISPRVEEVPDSPAALQPSLTPRSAAGQAAMRRAAAARPPAQGMGGVPRATAFALFPEPPKGRAAPASSADHVVTARQDSAEQPRTIELSAGTGSDNEASGQVATSAPAKSPSPAPADAAQQARRKFELVLTNDSNIPAREAPEDLQYVRIELQDGVDFAQFFDAQPESHESVGLENEKRSHTVHECLQVRPHQPSCCFSHNAAANAFESVTRVACWHTLL